MPSDVLLLSIVVKMQWHAMSTYEFMPKQTRPMQQLHTHVVIVGCVFLSGDKYTVHDAKAYSRSHLELMAVMSVYEMTSGNAGLHEYALNIPSEEISGARDIG